MFHRYAFAAAATLSAVLVSTPTRADDPDIVIPMYGYVVYSDASKTEQIDYVTDTCTSTGYTAHVNNPYISTNYYDQQELYYVCTEDGLYVPPA